MANFGVQLNGFQLTTAQILYHLPDYPKFLQTYVWQDYDLAPKFPILHKFLEFWSRELDGKLHSVYVAKQEIITPSNPRFFDIEITIQ
jgi:uncharacterized protein Usg